MQITNKKVIQLLQDKDGLVKDGRDISKQIEKLEAKIKVLEDKEKAITGKFEPKELGEQAEKIQAEIQALLKKFNKVSESIAKEKMAQIPKKMEEEHKSLLTEKEGLERTRNKIALKVQKIKDRVVPLIQKEVKPQLGEYEDIEGVEVKNGVAKVKTFSHLEEFKARYNKTQQAK